MYKNDMENALMNLGLRDNEVKNLVDRCIKYYEDLAVFHGKSKEYYLKKGHHKGKTEAMEKFGI